VSVRYLFLARRVSTSVQMFGGSLKSVHLPHDASDIYMQYSKMVSCVILCRLEPTVSFARCCEIQQHFASVHEGCSHTMRAYAMFHNLFRIAYIECTSAHGIHASYSM